MSETHIAHLNAGRLRADWDDPLVADFVAALGHVNAIATRSAGFVWRFSDADMETAQDDPAGLWRGDPRVAATLSVWRSVEDLRHFVHDTLHGAFLRRRAEWFEPPDGPAYVIWPIQAGHIPGLAEAAERLAHLAAYGPSAWAFDFGWAGRQTADTAPNPAILGANRPLRTDGAQ
ncbi:MAG: DUF3291 domain-containing protein [Pseudomonadota bacterium]